LLSLLLVHDLSDCSLSFIIEFLKRLRIVDLCRIDLRIAFEDRSPDLLLGLLQIQSDEGFAANFFDFPYRIRSVDSLIKISFDYDLACFLFDGNVVAFELHVKLHRYIDTILDVRLC
jgi:hypothetical protein